MKELELDNKKIKITFVPFIYFCDFIQFQGKKACNKLTCICWNRFLWNAIKFFFPLLFCYLFVCLSKSEESLSFLFLICRLSILFVLLFCCLEFEILFNFNFQTIQQSQTTIDIETNERVHRQTIDKYLNLTPIKRQMKTNNINQEIVN